MKRYIKADIVDIGDEDYGTKYEVARSRTARDSTLANMIYSDNMDPHTLVAIATNINASLDTIKSVLGQLDHGEFQQNPYGAYYEVVEYLSTCCRKPEVLEYLATNSMWAHPSIRINVAKNYSTPVALLTALADDEDPSVRYEVCRNPDLPIEVLHDLCDDRNVMVQRVAEKYYSLRTRVE